MRKIQYVAGIPINEVQNQLYKSFSTGRAQNVVVALDKSGVPFSASYDGNGMTLVYDSNFSYKVDEIIGKAMSGRYELLLREIGQQNGRDSYLKLLSEVAGVLHTTVGTLKQRPYDVQLLLCKSYADHWLCDTYTIQRELNRYLTANGRTVSDMSERERLEMQKNNTPEKRESTDSADIQHRMNVIYGQEDHLRKAEITAKEEKRAVFSREKQRELSEITKHRKQYEQELNVKSQPVQDENYERKCRP